MPPRPQIPRNALLERITALEQQVQQLSTWALAYGSPKPKAAAAAKPNEVYIDAGTGVLSFKDAAGGVHPLY